MEQRDSRAEKYAKARTAGELTQLTGELAIAQSQVSSGSLASRLIAAYAGAIETESDRRTWEEIG